MFARQLQRSNATTYVAGKYVQVIMLLPYHKQNAVKGGDFSCSLQEGIGYTNTDFSSKSHYRILLSERWMFLNDLPF